MRLGERETSRPTAGQRALCSPGFWLCRVSGSAALRFALCTWVVAVLAP